NGAFPMFLGTFSAFILLVLVSVSAPLVHSFYYLRTSADDGVRFGVWGYCGNSGNCTAPQLGYTYGSEISESTSKALILYPVAAAISLFSMMTVAPLMCNPRRDRYPHPLFCVLSFAASALSIAAFVISVYLASTATTFFASQGHSSSFGPTIWMSLVAAVLLLFVAFHAGCGTCF
ncbi:uncharacterized protein LAESUDRAFT_625901, partial [Laetiporus sulphureus 93-53]